MNFGATTGGGAGLKYGTLALTTVAAGLAIAHTACSYTEESNTCTNITKYGTWVGGILATLGFGLLLLYGPGSNSFANQAMVKNVMKFLLPVLALVSAVGHSALAGNTTVGEGKLDGTTSLVTLVTSVLTAGLFAYEVFRGQAGGFGAGGF